MRANASMRSVRSVYHPGHRKCAICWEPEPCRHRLRPALEMAHIIGRGLAGKNPNRPENVVMLCSSCHGAQHRTGYVYEGVRWPDLGMVHLLLAKAEMDELEVLVLAEMWGVRADYIVEMLDDARWPIEILRMRAARYDELRYNYERRFEQWAGISSG